MAIPKPQGGLRPISIGEVIPRLMNRAIAAVVSPKIGKTMVPLQWGVGVRGGAEVVSHGVQLGYDAIVGQLEATVEARRLDRPVRLDGGAAATPPFCAWVAQT